MKKKIFALVLCLVLVFAMNATSVFAGTATAEAEAYVSNGGDFIKADAMAAGISDLTSVYGFTFTIKLADPSQGVGGGIIINCASNNWDQLEWGNEGAGKEFTAVATDTENVYTVTRLSDAPIFAADDTYANVAISNWWGSDFAVIKADFLAADGSVIALGAAEATEETVETAEETTVETTETVTEELPKTGAASAAVFYAVGSLVSAAGVMVAKRKDEQ